MNFAIWRVERNATISGKSSGAPSWVMMNAHGRSPEFPVGHRNNGRITDSRVRQEMVFDVLGRDFSTAAIDHVFRGLPPSDHGCQMERCVCTISTGKFAQKNWAVTDRPYSLGCAAVGAFREAQAR